MNNQAISIPCIRVLGREVQTVDGLAECLAQESDEFVRKSRISDEDQRADFQLSCDALNYWRMHRRIREERPSVDSEEIDDALCEAICRIRDYAKSDFELALSATKARVRSSFGLGPLEEAHMRSKKAGFRLLIPDLSSSETATDVAAIAWQLQSDLGDRNILLPIEQVRAVLERRKVVISGAVLRLAETGVLRIADAKYHTRRAREYRFVGVLGQHFQVGETNERES